MSEYEPEVDEAAEEAGLIRSRVTGGRCMGKGVGGIVYLNKTQLKNFGDVVKPYSVETEMADRKALQARREAQEAEERQQAELDLRDSVAAEQDKAAKEAAEAEAAKSKKAGQK